MSTTGNIVVAQSGGCTAVLNSSLVGVITVVELTKQMTITAVDLRGWLVPGLLCATLYLTMSYPLARIARRLEAKLERA